jgi:hypothetical protein
MWSNILLLFNSEMADRHPQLSLLESFWDNKHRSRLIVEEGWVSVDDCFYVFYLFCHYVVAHGANIFLLLLCSRTFAAAQDPLAQPPDMGRAVHTVHTACGVPIACSATHRRSANDGLHHIDGTCVSMVSEDPHVPPSVWGDHGDAVGHRHDPWSSHRRHAGLWDDVSRRVEGLRWGGYRPTTPRRSRRPEGQEDDGRSLRVAHCSLQHLPGGC